MPNVISKDGTRIAYDKKGEGPAVILINGALSVRSAGLPIAELLAPHFTVYCFDRRGRGDSTDTQPYSPDREVEDIEALIALENNPVHLFGSSSGGALAIEAAIRLGGKVKKLAVYEVPYDSSEAGVKAWREYRALLADLLKAGRREDAVLLFLRFVGIPNGMLEQMRNSPAWKSMEALAPTIAYDNAVLGENRIVPSERARSIKAQALVMEGTVSHETMPFMRATAEELTRAIPNARHETLVRQQHQADPKVIAPILTGFFDPSPLGVHALSGPEQAG